MDDLIYKIMLRVVRKLPFNSLESHRIELAISDMKVIRSCNLKGSRRQIIIDRISRNLRSLCHLLKPGSFVYDEVIFIIDKLRATHKTKEKECV